MELGRIHCRYKGVSLNDATAVQSYAIQPLREAEKALEQMQRDNGETHAYWLEYLGPLRQEQSVPETGAAPETITDSAAGESRVVDIGEWRGRQWEVCRRVKPDGKREKCPGVCDRATALGLASKYNDLWPDNEYWVEPCEPYAEKVLGMVGTCDFFLEKPKGSLVVREIGPDIAIGDIRIPGRQVTPFLKMLNDTIRVPLN